MAGVLEPDGVLLLGLFELAGVFELLVGLLTVAGEMSVIRVLVRFNRCNIKLLALLSEVLCDVPSSVKV